MREVGVGVGLFRAAAPFWPRRPPGVWGEPQQASERAAGCGADALLAALLPSEPEEKAADPQGEDVLDEAGGLECAWGSAEPASPATSGDGGVLGAGDAEAATACSSAKPPSARSTAVTDFLLAHPAALFRGRWGGQAAARKERTLKALLAEAAGRAALRAWRRSRRRRRGF